jgi:hypothetical protein
VSKMDCQPIVDTVTQDRSHSGTNLVSELPTRNCSVLHLLVRRKRDEVAGAGQRSVPAAGQEVPFRAFVNTRVA